MTKTPLFRPLPHESAALHVTGEALYVDDLPPPRGLLVGLVVPSPIARGRIRALDAEDARRAPGIHAVLTAAEIPGTNDVSPHSHDEPLLAEREVHAVGQAVALIVGERLADCRRAAAALRLELEELPPITSIAEAIAAGSFLTTPHVIARGDVEAALGGAAHVFEGEVATGGQDHFYLETHAALAIPEEDDRLRVWSSTQHPSEVQAKIAEVLGLHRHQVVVEVPRLGGGFGGKETQGAHFAALAALGARATGRPVKVWLNRDQDMIQTGKRHPFWSRYRAGFDASGRLVALDVRIFSDGGWSADLSGAIMDRALFHLDNAYYVEHLRFEGRVCRTNTASNTAMRGFGGPQGMVVVESILNRAAVELGIDPVELRRRNFYGEAPRDRTPYGQAVLGFRLPRIVDELLRTSDYANRQAAILAHNRQGTPIKRGLALMPLKFGISFTTSMLNQAGAWVLLFTDGTLQVNHGGVEMGQGLHTKMRAIAAHELGLPETKVRVMNTATDKVPNTSATAASSGADLNGQAVRAAVATIRARLAEVAGRALGVPPDRLAFVDERIGPVDPPGPGLELRKVIETAYVERVPLSAAGFYATPGIHYDRERGRGEPFYYFAQGAAVLEVEVNGLTGEHRLTRADLLEDVGDSLVPTVDRGQIEGAFLQGLGWLTMEELVFDGKGRLRTHSPDTYKIPAAGDAPLDFRVELLAEATQPGTIHGSKAVGEPPLMLAIGVLGALDQAIRAFAPAGARPRPAALRLPATPEAVLRAIAAATTEG